MLAPNSFALFLHPKISRFLVVVSIVSITMGGVGLSAESIEVVDEDSEFYWGKICQPSQFLPNPNFKVDPNPNFNLDPNSKSNPIHSKSNPERQGLNQDNWKEEGLNESVWKDGSQNANKVLKPEEGYGEDWEICWDVSSNKENLSANSIRLGYPWNSQKMKIGGRSDSGEFYPSHGYATYRWKVSLPDSEREYSLYLPSIATAYRIYANGKYLGGTGIVGKNKETAVPFLDPTVVDLPVGKEVEIVFHVSNYDHVNGGIWKKIRLGPKDEMVQMRERGIALDLFVFGSFFIIAIYHFGLFILRKQDRSTLFFGAFLLLLSFRSLVTGEDFLYQLLGMENFTLDWGLRIEYWSFFFGVPLTVGYLHSIFPEQVSKKISIFFSGLFGILGVSLIFFPSSIFTTFVKPAEVVFLFACVYGFWVIVSGAMNRVEGGRLFLIGFTVFFLSAINDILYTQNILDTGYYAHVGFYLFVLIQSFLISRRFSKAFERVEVLSANLEKMVELRTREYKIEKEKAENAGEWKNNLISLVAHDLRSPLSSFYSALELLGDDDLTEEERKAIIQESKRSIQHSLFSISHLLNLDRFQSGDFTLNLESVRLVDLLEESLASLKQELEDKFQKVTLDINTDSKLLVDRHLFKEIIRNVVLNAIKFSPKNSEILIFSTISEREFRITIRDQGMGMSPEVINNLLNGVRQDSTRGTGGETGFGMGMSICVELVRVHGGHLEIESKIDQGSSVSIVLPGV